MILEIVTTAANGETNSKCLCKKLAIVRLGVSDRRRRLWLVKCVASLVLFTHPIDNEHDDCDSENQTNDGEADTHCNSMATARWRLGVAVALFVA